MTRRILTVAFAAAIAVLLTLASPASAKGPQTATITGPGIDGVRLTWNGPELGRFLKAARVWDFMDQSNAKADPPTGRLGPRFDVVYELPDLAVTVERKRELIRQELFPFAAGGPVVHMVTAKSLYNIDVHAGWLRADRKLVAVLKHLRDVDAKRTTPARTEPVAHDTATRQDAGSGDGSTRAFVFAGVGGAVLATAAAAARLRRRSSTGT